MFGPQPDPHHDGHTQDLVRALSGLASVADRSGLKGPACRQELNADLSADERETAFPAFTRLKRNGLPLPLDLSTEPPTGVPSASAGRLG